MDHNHQYINVTAYQKLNESEILYDGEIIKPISNLTSNLQLYECADEETKKGHFFTNLSKLVNAIDASLEALLDDGDLTDNDIEGIHFASNTSVDGSGIAFLSSYGTYLQRSLNETELKELLTIADQKLRHKYMVS